LSQTSDTAAHSQGLGLKEHPRGLYYLVFTEAWERFSYYGMTSLLGLYMVDQLLRPASAAHIAGLGALRNLLETVSGPLSTQALASQIFGLYTGFVYFTPLAGGWIADRWSGQRNAVAAGALFMSAGHAAMTFDASFLIALVLLVVGSGLLKGNIAAQVGVLYPEWDEERRTRGFVIFSTAINVGAVLGPLVCGLLAQIYGWHYGFGIAAVLMLLALAVYLHGYRHLPARVERRGLGPQIRMSGADWRVSAALVALMLISVPQSIAYLQMYDVGPVWTEQHVARSVAGLVVPVPWYQSVTALASIAAVAPLLWLWRRQAARAREPDEIAKMGLGAWLAAACNLLLAAASYAAADARMSPLWPLLYVSGLGVAFLYYWPTMLALVSRCAPQRVNSTLIGLVYVSLFISNTMIGWIGGFYERISPVSFWTLHGAIAAAGGIAVALFGARLRRILGLTGQAGSVILVPRIESDVHRAG
jgi:POT family proton-dependent oligopeptide transporter